MTTVEEKGEKLKPSHRRNQICLLVADFGGCVVYTEWINFGWSFFGRCYVRNRC